MFHFALLYLGAGCTLGIAIAITIVVVAIVVIVAPVGRRSVNEPEINVSITVVDGSFEAVVVQTIVTDFDIVVVFAEMNADDAIAHSPSDFAGHIVATAVHFANWQKEQLMKEAVDGYVSKEDSSIVFTDAEMGTDKVKVMAV